jgi:PTH1 family peptidyl-tRNA hydrolase
MLLLVGLGNPGARHANNRHNIGFMAVDAIARRHGFSPWRRRFQGQSADGTVAGVKVLALKPETYMNESGRSVGEALRFYKLEPASVVVFYDELDLQLGKVRVKLDGGNAGHNGLRSIDAHIGKDYWRVRLGIGHPGDKHLVHSHVLKDFSKEEANTVAKLLDAVAAELPRLIEGDDGAFMSRVAHVMTPPKPKPEPRPEPKPETAPGSKPGPKADDAAAEANKAEAGQAGAGGAPGSEPSE